MSLMLFLSSIPVVYLNDPDLDFEVYANETRGTEKQWMKWNERQMKKK